MVVHNFALFALAPSKQPLYQPFPMTAPNDETLKNPKELKCRKIPEFFVEHPFCPEKRQCDLKVDENRPELAWI